MSREKDPEGMIRYHFLLPEDLKNEAELLASERGETLSQMIRAALRLFISVWRQTKKGKTVTFTTLP